MCVYVCMYVYCVVVLVSSDPLRGDVPCRLVVFRGTPTRECARTNFFSEVYIRYVDFESKRQTNSEALYIYTFCSYCVKYVTEVKHTEAVT